MEAQNICLLFKFAGFSPGLQFTANAFGKCSGAVKETDARLVEMGIWAFEQHVLLLYETVFLSWKTEITLQKAK